MDYHVVNRVFISVRGIRCGRIVTATIASEVIIRRFYQRIIAGSCGRFFGFYSQKYSVIEDGVWSSGAGEFDRFFFLLCIQTFNRKIEGDQSLISNFKIGTLYLKLIVSITLCREDTKLIVYVIGKSLTCLTPMFVSIEKQPQFLDIKIFFFLFIELNDHRTDRDEIFIHINS